MPRHRHGGVWAFGKGYLFCELSSLGHLCSQLWQIPLTEYFLLALLCSSCVCLVCLVLTGVKFALVLYFLPPCWKNNGTSKIFVEYLMLVLLFMLMELELMHDG